MATPDDRQPRLPFHRIRKRRDVAPPVAPPVVVEDVPRCAFGETGQGWRGPHHCRRCADAVDAACRFCEAEIAAGRYDAEFYTPAERRAQQKRRAAEMVPPPAPPAPTRTPPRRMRGQKKR